MHRSRMFTILSNFIFIVEASDSASGMTLSLVTALSDGVDVEYSCLFNLCNRSVGCDTSPSVSRIKHANAVDTKEEKLDSLGGTRT